MRTITLLACTVSLAACATDHTGQGPGTTTITASADSPGNSDPKHDDQYCPTCPTPSRVPGLVVLPTSPLPTPPVSTTSLPPAPPDPIAVDGIQLEHHDTFDRVIYSTGSVGIPAWQADYVAEATPRGRPTALLVTGRSILRILFYAPAPEKVGLPAYIGPNPLAATGFPALTEVHLTQAYDDGSQSTTESFIGTDATRPHFTVTRLLDPPRLAVDVYR
ncbi:hypothetical protein GCM10027167_66010 [Nocardia heshunensis]